MDTTINIDQNTLLGPVIAASLTAAYYSALQLKKKSGIEITKDIEAETLTEVMTRWNGIMGLLEQLPTKKVSLGTSQSHKQ